MIAKKIPNPKAASSKSARVGLLLNYIVQPEHEIGLEKCIHSEGVNFICDDLNSQIAEMVALASESVRSKDPVDHWVLSWQSGEQPTIDQAREAVAIAIKQFGLEGHQFVWALHDDTDNLHAHIAVNRVHPDTCKVVKINKGFDKEAGQQAIALIENAQGWKPERGARYQVIDGKPVIKEKANAAPSQPLEPSTKSKNHEIQTGEKSVQRVGIEEAAPIIERAQSWPELHTAMQAAGMEYIRKGSGAIIQIGDATLKASDVDRKASIGALQKRLGPYQPPGGINSNDHHHHAPNTRRTSTGAIEAEKQNAAALRKFSKNSLRTLSECNMALDKTGHKIENKGVLLVDGSINNRRIDGVRRTAGRGAGSTSPGAPSSRDSGLRITHRSAGTQPPGRGIFGQPVKPDQPAWIEYQAIKAERSEAKSAELLTLRTQHDADKDKLHAAHVAERADLIRDDWKNKGNFKSAFASVVAAKQAAEKIALREQHKEQRDALHAKYQPLPQYRAWVQQPRLLAPVATMTPSIPPQERLSTVLMALTHSQDKRGMAYQDKGQELFVDQGRTLVVVNHEQQSTRQIAAALAVAQHKFGSVLEVTGPDEFKQSAIEAAVAHELNIKFADASMEAKRMQMMQAKQQAERDAQRAQQEQQLAEQSAAQAQQQAAAALALDAAREAAEQVQQQEHEKPEPTPIQKDPAQPVQEDLEVKAVAGQQHLGEIIEMTATHITVQERNATTRHAISDLRHIKTDGDLEGFDALAVGNAVHLVYKKDREDQIYSVVDVTENRPEHDNGMGLG